jgi:hypothetical protein
VDFLQDSPEMVVAGGDAHDGHSAVHFDIFARNVKLLIGLAFGIEDTFRNMQTGTHHPQFEDV